MIAAGGMRMRCLIFALGLLAALAPVPTAADPIVEIESRGQRVRAVLLKPANPKGAVILPAGGDGRLDITPGGLPRWQAGRPMRNRQAMQIRSRRMRYLLMCYAASCCAV